MSSPDPSLAVWEDKPEDEWSDAHMLSGVWTIFPHVSIADFDADGKLYMVSQLFPGATPETSVTVQNFLAVDAPGDERKESIANTMRFLDHVVRDEDYFTGLRQQRALRTGAKPDVLFGRNEGGAQRFHRWVDALVATEDADLDALLRAGVEGA